MDMHISGSGRIATGEYNNVRISGSGSMEGLIRCRSLHVSGSVKGNELDCKDDIKISGSCKFTGNLNACELAASGAFSCGGDITVENALKCSGAGKCGGSIRCGSLSVAGALRADKDIEADLVRISGKLVCEGLLNAEDIIIRSGKGSRIGSIGGSRIVIGPEDSLKRKWGKLISLLFSAGRGMVVVENAVEGDSITVENLKAKRVSGRIVAIGENCEIDLVQYSESVEISPKAKVGTVEQI